MQVLAQMQITAVCIIGTMKPIIGVLFLALCISTAMCQSSAAAAAASSNDGEAAASAAAYAGDGTAVAAAAAVADSAAPDDGGDSSPDEHSDENDKDDCEPGPPPPLPCDYYCPQVYAPVCADNGKTFGNECLLNCENEKRKIKNLPPLYIVYNGVCITVPCNCNCFKKKDPVCGVNLKDKSVKAYYNYCYMICASDQSVKDHNGKIESTCANCDKSCVCPYIKNPVCATNGKTFGSPCLLCCENKRLAALNLPLLNIDYYGKCIYCPCPNQFYFPVCATDGNTYPNGCKLKCADDIRKLKNLPLLKLVNQGPCKTPKCEDKCKKQKFKPVCGTDGKNYYNLCYLNCANLSRPKGTPPILLLHTGYCKLNC